MLLIINIPATKRGISAGGHFVFTMWITTHFSIVCYWLDNLVLDHTWAVWLFDTRSTCQYISSHRFVFLCWCGNVNSAVCIMLIQGYYMKSLQPYIHEIYIFNHIFIFKNSGYSCLIVNCFLCQREASYWAVCGDEALWWLSVCSVNGCECVWYFCESVCLCTKLTCCRTWSSLVSGVIRSFLCPCSEHCLWYLSIQNSHNR